MGNCFSHGSKGRHRSGGGGAPNPRQKDKEEISWETTTRDGGEMSQMVASNGNTEPVPKERPSNVVGLATLYSHHHAHQRSVLLSNSSSISISHNHSQRGVGGGGIGGNSGGGDQSKPGKTVHEGRVSTLFDTYRDHDHTTEDVILADGIERLCSDLSLSPDEFRVLLLAWKFDAAQMCRFTRSEFIQGCRNMHVDTLRGIQQKLPEIVNEVSEDPEKFKQLYRFTFRFGLDSGQGQRILPSDMAVLLWRLVFSVREPPILNRWLRFLECHPHVRGIPRDTWNMFLNFAEAVGDDLSTYDDAEAWPSIFDDFVEFENDQANQNITTKDKDSIIQMEP